MFVFSDRLTRVQVEEAADFLNHHCPFINTVELVIQLGSGLDPTGLLDEQWSRFPLQDMPHMPSEASAAGHGLDVIWGTIGQTKVLVYSGRYHLYEGYGRIPCLLPIWAATACGARTFLLTNAAGAVKLDLEPGTFLCLSDHINHLGVSALSGHQHLLAEAFVDMGQVYSAELRSSLLQVASQSAVAMTEGVYMAFPGPQFETPAEVRLARLVGADAVGMSTVLEATAAHAMKARVAALSLITNPAAGLGDRPISHKDHLAAGKRASEDLNRLIRAWLAQHGERHL